MESAYLPSTTQIAMWLRLVETTSTILKSLNWLKKCSAFPESIHGDSDSVVPA